MTFDLLSLHDETEPVIKKELLKPPFPYPGGKSRSVPTILEHLPTRSSYIEVFGGSAAVLLAKTPSKLEVYNDRYGAVVDFYRCMRDPEKLERLMDMIDLSVHAREEFQWCKETWENQSDIVERAYRWYYLVNYSFASLCRNFGRGTSRTNNMSGKARRKLKLFPTIHERFKNVLIENQDWKQCLHDYDHEDAVFYLDPPYVDTDSGIYKNKMKHDCHRDLIDTVMGMKAFVAVSGYSNPLYDNNDWDDMVEWDAYVSIKSAAYSEGNNKEHLKDVETRGHAKEKLWIKEARV